MKTMDNHTPHFPLFSILLGMIMGAGSYIVENSFIVASFGEFLKVVVFGLVGGYCGYLGRRWGAKLHDKINNNCKSDKDAIK